MIEKITPHVCIGMFILLPIGKSFSLFSLVRRHPPSRFSVTPLISTDLQDSGLITGVLRL